MLRAVKARFKQLIQRIPTSFFRMAFMATSPGRTRLKLKPLADGAVKETPPADAVEGAVVDAAGSA